MAAGIGFFIEHGKIKKLIGITVLILFIALNLFQTWQYKNGAIHYDDMSREAYFYGFFQTKPTLEWADLLKPYDWERRIAGKEQIEYDKFLLRQDQNKISLRASNLMYVGVNERAQNAMGALSKEPGPMSEFSFFYNAGNDFFVFSSKDLAWVLRPDLQNVITASSRFEPKTHDKLSVFQIIYVNGDEDNRIAIKAPNGKYVSIGDQWPFILKANADKVGKNEIFRYFILDK
jgi:hypothetical protein